MLLPWMMKLIKKEISPMEDTLKRKEGLQVTKGKGCFV